MLRFAFVDIFYKKANSSYQKYKEAINSENKSAMHLKNDHKYFFKEQKIEPFYFTNDKYRWNQDYSKLALFEKEKKYEKIRKFHDDDDHDHDDDDDLIISLTITALTVGLGVYVFRRSFYLK
jgi:hypothetical protein